jgi:hypothetical protein
MTDTVEPGGAGRTISRRTVAKGAAWSVPAVLIAKSTPALAASPPIVIDFGDSTACKLPGNSWGSAGYNKGYVLWGQFVNTLDTTVSFRVTDIVVGGIDQCLVGVTNPALPTPCPPQTIDCITLGPNEEQVYGVFSNASTDSSSTDVAVSIEYWVGDSTCGAAGSGQVGVTSGNVVGQSWTTDTGGGSCKFPYDEQDMCLTPPPAGACAS